jgi:hypothetical protein
VYGGVHESFSDIFLGSHDSSSNTPLDNDAAKLSSEKLGGVRRNTVTLEGQVP